MADALGEDVDVLERIEVTQQPEAHLAVVGEDRDRERVLVRQEGDRRHGLELAPEHVERELRARARS